MRTPATCELLAADGAVLVLEPGDVITIGRAVGPQDADLALTAPPGAVVDVSAVAAQIHCHPTNIAVRVYQRPPGYLLAEVVDDHRRPARRQTLAEDDVLLTAGPLTALTLRLGDGPTAAELPIGHVRFTPVGPPVGVGSGTRQLEQEYPREQWARWLVSAYELWAADPHAAVPSEAATKSRMRQHFGQWPTTNPAEPRRAVAEALYHYGLDPAAIAWRRYWHDGLNALFSAGWPRQGMVEWVAQTADETGWAPVGLGGRQGPRFEPFRGPDSSAGLMA